MRTTYCGLVSEALMGQTVTLMGWAHRRRDHGGVIFVDLRDREGLVQIVCDPDRAEMFAVAEGVRNEFCLKIVGKVRARPEGTANANLVSGKVEVLATPVLVNLMEAAALQAAEHFLPAGHQSLGTRLEIRHVAATPVGMKVVATAEVVKVEGRLITFRVEARDEKELVGDGLHDRVVVNVERFDQRVQDKVSKA